MSKLITALILLSLSTFSYGASTPKYREAGKIDFESLLIEGQKKKPDYSVVTGNLGEKDLGLLKLRTDFLDTMADTVGEEVVK